jgi:Na+/H+-dicarboxylate symporter
MAVVPLVVMQLLTAISGNGNGSSVGTAGRRFVVLVVVMFCGLAIASFLISAPLVRLYSVSAETVQTIRESVLIPTTAMDAVSRTPATTAEWLQGLVPTNVLEAAARGDLIQILFVTVMFGLAVNRLPEEQRQPLARAFRALSEAILILVRWILLLTPVGVFALIVGFALGTGADAVGLLGAYVLMNLGVLFILVLSLYPLTAALGKVSISAFARAAAYPQLVGFSTRSSLASLPAQIERGKATLGFGPTTAGFTVPLCVAVLKVSSAIGGPLRLLFLAHVFGVTLSFSQLLTFTITILLISLTTIGIPRGGAAFRSLPAFVAVGIPVEGLVILQAVKDLRDYGITVANTTGQLAAATILSTADRAPERKPTTQPIITPSPVRS